jgi:hypothetical protein
MQRAQQAAYTPQILAKSGLPFVLPPSGNMGNNGAFTWGTACSRAVAACFCWFAAGQIAAGSAAGWYYATMSSATAMTVFNNTYSPPGVPIPPSQPVAFATTGPGAITGVTAATTGPQITIPATFIGLNGVLRATLLWSVNASANAKTLALNMNAGANYGTVTLNTVAQFGGEFEFNLTAQSSSALQLTAPSGLGIASGASVQTTYNLAAAATWAATLTDAVATDWQILEAWCLEGLS